MPYFRYNSNDFYHSFTDLLKSNNPCWITRVGGSDFQIYSMAYEDKNYDIEIIKNYNGYFDKQNSSSLIKDSSNIYFKSINNSDIVFLASEGEDFCYKKFIDNNLKSKFIKDMKLSKKKSVIGTL